MGTNKIHIQMGFRIKSLVFCESVSHERLDIEQLFTALSSCLDGVSVPDRCLFVYFDGDVNVGTMISFVCLLDLRFFLLVTAIKNEPQAENCTCIRVL